MHRTFFSKFGPKDTIVYNKNIGFELIRYKHFCPINILDDLYCLDFLYINENQRGICYGMRFLKMILNYFQIVLHTIDSSVGFFEHMSKDFGLEKINTGLPLGKSFISLNLKTNRLLKVKSCLGGCGLKFTGYKRYACPNCSMRFVIENTDKELIKLNFSLRSKIKKEY